MATITGTILDDVLPTTAGVDVLTALNGNDVVLIALAAGHGAGENLDGGAGYDRLWFTSTLGGDTLVLTAATKNFESIQLADASGSENGTVDLHINASALLTGVRLTGNEADNSLTGTAKDDILEGGIGEDFLIGGLGNDRVVMQIDGGATDIVNAGAQAEGNTLILAGVAPEVAIIDLTAADQIVSFDVTLDTPLQSGFSHVDASGVSGFGVRITGSAGKNALIGSPQDDAFVVASSLHYIATDAISGGAGEDVLRFSSTIALQTLTLNALLVGVERAEIADETGDVSGTTVLKLSAAAVKSKMTLAGNDGDNTITGTAFDDTIFGNGGADSLAGGKGNDIYEFDDAGDGVAGDRITEAVGAGIDAISFTSTVAGSMLVLGAAITGVEGAYAMGLDSTGAAFDIDETTDRGIDGSALLATFGLKFTGNAGANTLIGGKGKDTLTGNAGIDSILGGLGADLIVMDVDATSIDVIDAGDAAEGNTLKLVGELLSGPAVIDLSVAANADQLGFLDGAAELSVQSDFLHVDASELTGDHGVKITGSALGNILVGSSQDDIFVVISPLDFKPADAIQGGGGNDVLRFTSTIAGQTFAIGANITTLEEVILSDVDGDSSGLTTLSLNAAAAKSSLILTGNAGLNTLTGGAADDTLNGAGGIDVMVGGLGDNEYRYENAADFVVGERITDDVGVGDDSVRFASTTNGEILVLTNQVVGIERLILDEPVEDTLAGANIGIDGSALAKAVRATGNDGNNTIIGTKGDDYIEGGKGVDSVVGGLGKDTIVVNIDYAEDAIAGAYLEGNLLKLTGDSGAVVFVDLSATQGLDQSDLGGMQSGFAHVDGSALVNGGIDVFGSIRADSLTGGANTDYFQPGLGNDIIQGGGGDDVIVIRSQAELGADIYNDSGNTAGDYIYFDNTVNGTTLTIGSNNVFGFDIASTGLNQGTTTNLNINASAVDKPFGLSGNAGRNVLTSTRHGETIFDWGGADTMAGGAGDDDYVIVNTWVHGALGIGDKVQDSAGFDDMYNATGDPSFSSSPAQVIIVNLHPGMVTGIERFVISGAQLSQGGDYRRVTDVDNDAGFDLSLYGAAAHLAGSYGDNYLRATRFNDTIIGNKGEDTILGGAGTDLVRMEVGAGDVDEINAGLAIENNRLVLEGTATGTMVFDLNVADGVDQLVSIGGAAETLVQTGFRSVDAGAVADFGVEIIGSSAANLLVGSAQDDVLDGRGGADKLFGGGGNDAFVIDGIGNFIAGDLFDGGEGNDTVRFASVVNGQILNVVRERLDGIEIIAIADATGDTTGLTALNVAAATYDEKLEIIGNDGNNSISATNLADTLQGGGGIDTLRGNAGNDIYVAFAPGEVVAGDSISDTSGTADIFRFTSETDGEVVVLTNLMTGLEFAETANALGELTEVFNTGIDASAMAVKISLRGNDGDNALTGSAFGDAIAGGKGVDVIQGGLGADTITMALVAADMDDIDGGDIAEGNLLLLVGDPGGAMVWDLSSGTDQLVSVGGADEGRTILDMTHIDASGMTGPAITVTGSAQANTIIGTKSNDTFIVLAAADFAVGERIVGGANDTGTDIDVLRFTSTTGGEILLLTGLVSGIEALQVSDAAGVLTGTAAVGINAAAVGKALKIEGNDGANALTGTAFADTIIGGDGTDTIVAGAGADEVRMQMTAGSIDAVNAGAATEGNKLVLSGAAAGAAVINLTLAADQLAGTGEALVQSGFMHLDASAMTGGMVTVTGTSGNNSISGTALADIINAGAGTDTIGFNVGGGSDQIDAGLLSEGNILLLTGAAPSNIVVDLSSLTDQVTFINGGDPTLQFGFTHLDASAMTGNGVDVTGSSAANSITGTALADTILGGGGADRIVWIASGAADLIDAGNPADGDIFVLTGTAGGVLELDLGAVTGADQLLSIGGGAEGVVQANFQHLDARALGGNGIDARGNGLNNTFHGSDQADTMAGLAGSDTFWLGGGDGVDASADHVVYERPQDGINAAGAVFSFDRIREFKTGQDKVDFDGAFNGGPNELDDIVDNGTFQFATDAKADFSLTHEALLITATTSKLAAETTLSASSFSSVLAAINKLGVVAATGDDGLIVVQTAASTGMYYYQELDGILNKVSAGELTLLGVFDAKLGSGDVALL